MNFRPTGKLNAFMEMTWSEKKVVLDEISNHVTCTKKVFEPFQIVEGFMPEKEDEYDPIEEQELHEYFDLLSAEYDFEKRFESRYNDLYYSDTEEDDEEEQDMFDDDEEY